MEMRYEFTGEWITNSEFYNLKPRNVFHRQLEPLDLPCDKIRNKHILFRKSFKTEKDVDCAKIFITADDYYKLYINGKFVAQGPSPSYHFRYNYNVINIGDFIQKGENVIAVHTLYQGLINRVWQSGDNRHGLILDVVADGEVIVKSDESFKTCEHSAYKEIGIAGYQTQFLEEYDSRSLEVGFESLNFSDKHWENAKISKVFDHTLTEQKSDMLEFEKILPKTQKMKDGKIFCDFGSNYVGYLNVKAHGKAGDEITVRCGQELDENSNVRWRLRANCDYEEKWILSDKASSLDWFDYKSFRYVELLIPPGCEIEEIYLNARHYPFELKAKLKEEFKNNRKLQAVWNLCINTQKYGVQEVIQDCMEREKGFYVGDGCYTALTHMLLTKDDSMVRKLIDDGFSAEFITDGLVTCLNCSFMQEIAEYPLMLIYLVMWHYRITKDGEYLKQNYEKSVKVLEAYRTAYERDFLLCDLDKWCVVEWPKNFQHNYDIDITEGKICHQPHISLNAYYLEAVKTVNFMAKALNLGKYRDTEPMIRAFYDGFYDKNAHLFKDGIETNHICIVGNLFPFAFKFCPDENFKENMIKMIQEMKISSVSLFGAFLVLEGLVRNGKSDMIGEIMSDDGAWMRMLREEATTTFEGWGKETKSNASLFHLTMSYGAAFLADVDLEKIFD